MSKLIIVGAGGFGLEVAAYAEDARAHDPAQPEIVGFLDDSKSIGSQHGGYPVLGETDGPYDPDALYILAVGFPAARRALAEKLSAQNVRFHTLIHPQSYCARTARLAEGCILVPFATVGPDVFLGPHVMLNHYAVIGHEARAGSFCVLCPHASVHGGAILEDDVFVGSGGYVTRGVKIGAGAKISAGSVVYNDMPPGALALGNPAVCRKAE